ncbi:MAG: hypothetical protein GTN80_10865, partial [Nitrososphaeria archaeon]|nr:hypothetical protein [Nitrososphaeria archaeon]
MRNTSEYKKEIVAAAVLAVLTVVALGGFSSILFPPTPMPTSTPTPTVTPTPTPPPPPTPTPKPTPTPAPTPIPKPTPPPTPMPTPTPVPQTNQLKTFTSQEELENFIAEGLKKAEEENLLDFFILRKGGITSPIPAPVPAPSTAEGVTEYSTTNIQVAGVDEADIVKTDGEFIYVASNNRFLIVEAFPPKDMKVISATLVKGRIIGLFINGDRLVVFEESESSVISSPNVSEEILPPRLYGVNIKVYDVLEREDPSLVREVFVSGVYVNSRMIGDFVYVVGSQPATYWIQESWKVVLPTISVDGEAREIPASQIHYADSSDVPTTYTLIVALDVGEEGEEPEWEVFLTGIATSIYVSPENIYITMPKDGWWEGEGSTVIHRIAVDGSDIACVASGEVPGRVLNQFSMDEFRGYFRIATTTGHVAQSQATSANHVYILDEAMKIVGRLEDLAPGERIYSARFMGERCYLVTFK